MLNNDLTKVIYGGLKNNVSTGSNKRHPGYMEIEYLLISCSERALLLITYVQGQDLLQNVKFMLLGMLARSVNIQYE